MSTIYQLAKFGTFSTALMVSLVAGRSLDAQVRSELSAFPDRQLNSEARQEQSSQNAKNQPKPQGPITKARRNELMSFVNDNHPELKPLINLLKRKRPAQYNAAMRSLDRAVTRLNQLEISHSQQRYNQALQDWKLRSRIQLLSAQLSIKDTPARREQLEMLITKKIDNRISQLNAELEKTQKRLDRLTDLVTELESNRIKEIDRQWETAVSAAERIKIARQKRIQERKKQEKDKQENEKQEKDP